MLTERREDMLGIKARWGIPTTLAVMVAIVGLLGGSVLAAQADESVKDTIGSQEQIGRNLFLTIYNDNLALVRDVRNLSVPVGSSLLSFTDIPSRIDATSVILRSLTEEGSIRILEQNYEYDMVSGDKLLSKFLGQHIEVRTKDGTEYEGYLINAPTSGGSLILATEPSGGAITAIQRNEIEVIKYPSLPAGLVMRPTLVWDMVNTSDRTDHEMEVSYLTGGLSWSADYVLTLSDNDQTADLTGWVTITNNSGVEFENAELKLVAGDVHRVTDQVVYYDLLRAGKTASAAGESFEESSLFEYHLYKLEFPTTVKNNQTKQIQLLSVSDISVKKQFVFGRIPGYTRPYSYSDKVQVVLKFENSEENQMGMPLPEGRIRVNKADVDGSLEFVGEDSIDHTPRDEEITLYIGDAFDVTGKRINVSTTKVGSNSRKDAFRVELRNHKDEPVEVQVVESVYGDYEILQSSHEYTQIDANMIAFLVEVPANSQVDVTYEAMFTW